jgi:hypothetical protein
VFGIELHADVHVLFSFSWVQQCALMSRNTPYCQNKAFMREMLEMLEMGELREMLHMRPNAPKVPKCTNCAECAECSK